MKEPWIDWAMQIQALAQNGLTYTENVFDRERFEALRDISAQMLAHKSDIPKDKVKDLFCCEEGYQTPKVGSRGAVFEGGKILLVQENDGRWVLPGGWCDVGMSVANNTVKEVFEEAGLVVEPVKLIAMHDKNRNFAPKALHVMRIFVLCKKLSGSFQPNNETLASGYFSLDELPALAIEKVNKEQIAECFQAQDDPNWQVPFD